MWQRPDHLPAWPRIHGGDPPWWVDGVLVPTRWWAFGFLILIVAPYAVWAVLVDPSWWLGLVVGMVGYSLYAFVVVPWAMRLRGSRRGRLPDR